ncbi:hypothetical protein ACFL5U_01765 [Candidatus Margulisiibacteriota bacterium]
MPGLSVCSPQGCSFGDQPGVLQGHFATTNPDHTTMHEFVDMAGQDVDIEVEFINFQSGMYFPTQDAKTAAANNATLFLKIEPYQGVRFDDDKFDWIKALNKGTFDDFFVNMGVEIRKYGGPVLLTALHEMNIEDPTGVYHWTLGARGRNQSIEDKAKEIRLAFMRIHDLISKDEFVDPTTGERKKAGGANNAIWGINFDAGYYASVRKIKEAELGSYQAYKDFIKQRLDLLLPPEEYFDVVWWDFYVNDHDYERNRLDPEAVMAYYLDPVLEVSREHALLRNAKLGIGEFGVSALSRTDLEKFRQQMRRAGSRREREQLAQKIEKLITQERKAELVVSFLDYLKTYNAHADTLSGARQKLSSYVYFDKDKLWDPHDQGFWKLSDPVVRDAYRNWLTMNGQLFEDPPIFVDDATSIPFPFEGPAVPIADAQRDYSDRDWPQSVPPDMETPWNVPADPNLFIPERKICEHNLGKGKPLAERWRLEKRMPEEQLDVGIEALLAIDPKVPVRFSISGRAAQPEVAGLIEIDKKYPQTAFSPCLRNAHSYWENVTTFVSVYTQKAVEDQNKPKIRKAARVCELLLQRFELQAREEDDKKVKKYAYPTHHQVGQLKLILADAHSQLKDLTRTTYTNSIKLCLEAIDHFQELERGMVRVIHPTGADYFSIAKAVITIGDLKLRLAQMVIRAAQAASKAGNLLDANRHFADADVIFRETQYYYQAAADIDVSTYDPRTMQGGDGLYVDIHPLFGEHLELDVSVAEMVNSWENNQSRNYIRDVDRQRGFQGTFHFLKALGAIKVQGAFLENPTKIPPDYIMESLIKRLSVLQNSLVELEHDQFLEIAFLKGLAFTIKVGLLLMIADRAQFDAMTTLGDDESARVYFNDLMKTLGEILDQDPTNQQFADAVDRMQRYLIEDETSRILYKDKKVRYRYTGRGRIEIVEYRPEQFLAAEKFLDELKAKAAAAGRPDLEAEIDRVKVKLTSGQIEAKERATRVRSIDDQVLTDLPITPFVSSAANSKKFALIMVELVRNMVDDAYNLCRPNPGSLDPRFDYLYMLTNTQLAEMEVRTFYITEDPIDAEEQIGRVETAQDYLEHDDDWYHFQDLYLKGNLLILRDIGPDYLDALPVLDEALDDLKKFIYPTQIFYQAQIYLLQGEAYLKLAESSLDDPENLRAALREAKPFFEKAKKIVDKFRKKDPVTNVSLLDEINDVAPDIGWNLKDFMVRYSRLLAGMERGLGDFMRAGPTVW